MSPLTENTEQVRVTVEAGSPATEIFIIDGSFSLVEQGLDRLETNLPPGLYKIKFKTGSLIKERHQVVEPGSDPIRVSGPEMSFSTSAPLSQTRTTHEYHQYPAAQLSRELHRRLGQGSQFFFFGRDLEPGPPKNVALGLSLANLAGETLLDLARHSVQDSAQNWAGCTVELDPGLYRLRLQVGEEMTLEQSLVASPGWQSQVFWLRRNYGPGRPARRVDLANAAILMAPLGRGFDPNRDDLRTTELARQGLVNRRAVVSAEDLRQMLWAKFENPMLGIFGAHLLLLAAEPNLELLNTVVTNLRGLLGDHPDVLALALRLGQAPTGFAGPPLLRSSWRLIVQASATRPELVPAGSLAAQMAGRLWGEGAWLVWERPPAGEAAAAKEVTTRGDPSLRQTLARIAEMIEGREDLEAILSQGDLTDLEESLLRYALRMGSGPAKSALEMVFSTPQPVEPGLEADLVRTLGLPYAAIQQSLAGLSQKVAQLAGSGVITQRSLQVGEARSVIGSQAGGSIITGERNVIIGGVRVPRRQPDREPDLRAELAELDQTIANLRKHLSGPALDAALKELLAKRAALEAQLKRGGGVITEDSVQLGGEGSVIGSAARGDIITGSDNEIRPPWDEEEIDDN